MSNSNTCRSVWLAMTDVAIANLAGPKEARALSIMLGGTAPFGASLRRDTATVRIQRLTAFLALMLLGEFAQFEAAAMLLPTGYLPTSDGSRNRPRAMEVVGVS